MLGVFPQVISIMTWIVCFTEAQRGNLFRVMNLTSERVRVQTPGNLALGPCSLAQWDIIFS